MKKAPLFVMILIILCTGISFAQVLPGASFLRTTPGARLHAMSGTGAAGLDGIHSMYANPGIAGFMREGQWSASFTSWIADVYNASFIYGRRIRTPWSSRSRFSLGIFYQGMKEFDSTDGAAPLATANDLIVSATWGQPLTVISKWISIGASAKYFQSNLDYFSASAYILDAGLFYRTPRFNMPLNGFGIFKKGIISTGLSVTNLGNDLQYISVGTPLPRILRGGLSLNAGTHHGLQTHLSMDYIKFRDQESGLRFGFELSWNHLFAFSGGYQKNQGLLDQATFGLSVNLDNILIPVGAIMPETATALRLDIATQDEKDFFSRTYRGSASHYTIGPEAFRLQWPKHDAFYEHDSLVFTWEPSRDPDLYDDVAYHLIVGRDSTALADLLFDIRRGTLSPSSPQVTQTLLVNELLEGTSYELMNFPRGHYYWAVIAFDTDDHFRMAKRNGTEINYFYIPRPDLIVDKIEHDYYDLIDSTDFHGTLNIVIRNQGEMAAYDIPVALVDSVLSPVGNPGGPADIRQTMNFTIAELQPGARETLHYEWHRSTLGPCKITVIPDAVLRISELNDANNKKEEIFYTVPKGSFKTAADTSLALLTSRVVVELPFINQVNFAANSSIIEEYYLRNVAAFDATLLILAQRLQKHDSLRVHLVGYADKNSDDPSRVSLPSNAPDFSGQVIVRKDARAVPMTQSLQRRMATEAVTMPDPLFHLAYARAKSVQDSLIALDVNPRQVIIDSLKVLEPRTFSARAKQEDKDMLLHERRQVDIHASVAAEKILFEPVKKIDDEPVRDDILFNSNITYAADISLARATYRTELDGRPWEYLIELPADSLTGTVHWPISTIALDTLKRIIGSDIVYLITLTDTLERVFHNRPDTLVFSNDFALRQHRISFPLKFGQAQLLYGDYWNRIYSLGDSLFQHADSIRLVFEGHSCVIGGSEYNRTLSEKRAANLKAAYFDWVQQNHGDKLPTIQAHTDDEALGKGEDDPLKIYRLRTAPILIGDNRLPIGRKFNRRIEIIYYSPLIK